MIDARAVKLRAYFEKLGGHYHVRVFMGRGTRGRVGRLTMDENDWAMFTGMLDAAAADGWDVRYSEEPPDHEDAVT